MTRASTFVAVPLFSRFILFVSEFLDLPLSGEIEGFRVFRVFVACSTFVGGDGKAMTSVAWVNPGTFFHLQAGKEGFLPPRPSHSSSSSSTMRRRPSRFSIPSSPLPFHLLHPAGVKMPDDPERDWPDV